ncbi:phage baseplate assembly protein V [Sphingomonas limnosediminicola]|uniref:Phage baseplate assembly protein V n=1 Tax=Sphingomonas limnosediminicola TaxID=940133 RepID=A0ABP7LPX8_9SPHN
MTRRTRYFGKFRGKVFNSVDPLNLGRVQAIVPDVTGSNPTGWAMPCFPVAGMFMAPAVGANVWVEFEKGDLERPIWTGCFYADEAEVPVLDAPLPGGSVITMETAGQNRIAISDLPGANGGVILRSASGATVIVNDTGIYITNGKGASLTLTGPTVTINDGALSVT